MGLDALEGTVILPLVIYDPPPLIQYVQPPSHVAPTTCNEKVSDPFEGTTGFGRMGTRRALLFKALSILRAFSRAIHENHKRRTEATKPTIIHYSPIQKNIIKQIKTYIAQRGEIERKRGEILYSKE